MRFLLGCASMGYAKSCKGVLALVENLVANQVITKPSSSLPSQTMRNIHYVQNYLGRTMYGKTERAIVSFLRSLHSYLDD